MIVSIFARPKDRVKSIMILEPVRNKTKLIMMNTCSLCMCLFHYFDVL